jgi:excisionase family DNA binding protein
MENTTETNTVQAIWLRVPQAVQLTGLSRSKVYELLSAGAIRSASLRDPGQRHAVRLIDRADLLAFIESRATGGVVAK